MKQIKLVSSASGQLQKKNENKLSLSKRGAPGLDTNLHQGFPGRGLRQTWPLHHRACRWSPWHTAAWTGSPKEQSKCVKYYTDTTKTFWLSQNVTTNTDWTRLEEIKSTFGQVTSVCWIDLMHILHKVCKNVNWFVSVGQFVIQVNKCASHLFHRIFTEGLSVQA